MNTEPDISLFRPDRQGIRKVLGDLEAEIMELIWERPGDQRTTVREIFEVLYERRHLAYTTVMNTMVRLTKKGLLRAEKQEKAYVYLPTATQQEFISQFVDRILKDLVFNFSGAMMESLRALPDSEDVRMMRQRLDELTSRRAEEEED
jgi:predicted transcriptional regulator